MKLIRQVLYSICAISLLLHGTAFGAIERKTKVSSNDTTSGYLNGKLVAGTGVTFNENNDGGNETLTINASGSGSAVTLDIGDDSGNDSTDVSEIATTGDTNSVITEPSADKLLIDFSNNWPTADAATALSANGSNCSSGNSPLGVDASGASEGCFDVWTEAENTSAAYIANLSEDSTPQLGGELDAQGNNIIDLGNVTFQTGVSGGTLRTGTSAADKFILQAYDVDGGAYTNLIEADAGNTVTLSLAADTMHIEDATDSTKKLDFDLSGATGSTATTFTASQTADRTITLPDASTTLVGHDTTQTLTNKTINTASNTITVVEADISDLSHTTDTTLNLAGVETITGNWVNTTNPWADDEVVDTITASNYLPLAGGTLTGEVVVDNLGLEFTEGDDHTDCSAFSSTGGGIFYDDSEGVFKKCQDNTLSDLDTTAAGSGDAITVNSTTIDTTANFLDSIYGDFDIADGGAGGPDDITFTTEYGQTLAGNPALAVDQCIPFADTSGGGFLCEGSTADTNEQLYRFPDANGADTDQDIVLDDATQTLTNKTINTASNTITVTESDISDLSHTTDEVGTLTTGDLCVNNGSAINCTVNTEAELETALDSLDVVTVTTDDITSANLATAVSNETGTGALVFGTSPTFTTGVNLPTGSVDAATELGNDIVTHAQILDSDQATTKCIYFEDPTADDDFNSIWANKTANDFLLTEIWAESDQTVNLDLQVDDGTPADVNGTDISPAAGEAEDTSLSGDTTVAAGEELDLAITSVSGTPTWVSVCWTGNWVD